MTCKFYSGHPLKKKIETSNFYHSEGNSPIVEVFAFHVIKGSQGGPLPFGFYCPCL